MPRWIVTFALAVLLGANELSAQSYVITDLGTLGGPSSQARAIDNAGNIVGWGDLAADTHATIWRNAGVTNIPLIESAAMAISSDGRVVGTWDANVATRGFLRESNGTLFDMLLMPGFPDGNLPVGVNRFRQVVGNGWVGATFRPYSWQNDVYTDLIPVLNLALRTNVLSATVMGINDDGEIVGTLTMIAGQQLTNGFILANGQVRLIGHLGFNYSAASAINDDGDVTGHSRAISGRYHAILSRNGVLTDLGSDKYLESRGLALNNLDQVVGYAVPSAGVQRAIVATNGSIVDMNTLIDPLSGWVLNQATGINDAGTICGIGTFQGRQRAFRATPTQQTLKPAIPTGVIAFGQKTYIRVQWSPAQRATSYKVKRALKSTGPFTTIATVTTTNYNDSRVLRRTGYYYVVSAVNSAGESPNSSPPVLASAKVP